jgi:hypothetical protein
VTVFVAIAGALASGLCCWLLLRAARKERVAMFDSIKNGPTWVTTIRFDGTSETRRIR